MPDSRTPSFDPENSHTSIKGENLNKKKPLPTTSLSITGESVDKSKANE
jgi:hypothetical protein